MPIPRFAFADSMDREWDKTDQVEAAVFGLAPAALSHIFYSSPDRSFQERIDRADFLDKHWESSTEGGGYIGFKNADPRLHDIYVKEGTYGVQAKAPYIWSDLIGEHGTPWEPADISQSGEFQRRRSKHLPSILTVTPDSDSARFSTPETTSMDSVGGGASDTLWGNAKQPMYSYALGNQSVGRKPFANPSAHFSEVELPEAERTRYLTTSEANTVGDGRGWGVSGSKTAPVTSGRDVHFGKEYRKAGGLTAANDLYTWIKSQGFEPPDPTLHLNNPGEYLQELTKKVQEITGAGKSEYDVLESFASPTPLWGEQTRVTGTLPRDPIIRWINPKEGGLSKGSFEAGANTYFNIKNKSTANDWDPDKVQTHSNFQTDADAFVRDNVPMYPKSGPGRWLKGSHAPGVFGVLSTSPDAAAHIREGDYGKAALTTGASYAAGETLGAGANKLLDQAIKKGMYWAPRAAQGLANVAAPLLGVDILDTASTLMTGKNARELAVESGNARPFNAASMAPMTMAPLGMAGHINATVPVPADKQGRPQKVMAMRDGEEGYMLQGDPTSFIRGNWNPLQRRRYYAGGRVGDLD